MMIRLDLEYIAMVLDSRMDSEVNVPKKPHHVVNFTKVLHVSSPNVPYGEAVIALERILVSIHPFRRCTR